MAASAQRKKPRKSLGPDAAAAAFAQTNVYATQPGKRKRTTESRNGARKAQRKTVETNHTDTQTFEVEKLLLMKVMDARRSNKICCAFFIS